MPIKTQLTQRRLKKFDFVFFYAEIHYYTSESIKIQFYRIIRSHSYKYIQNATRKRLYFSPNIRTLQFTCDIYVTLVRLRLPCILDMVIGSTISIIEYYTNLRRAEFSFSSF